MDDKRIKDLERRLDELERDIDALPSFEIKQVEVIAQASTEVSFIVSAESLNVVKGLVEISTTSDETPVVEKYNTAAMKVTYDYGASTTGKQHYTYLIVGE